LFLRDDDEVGGSGAREGASSSNRRGQHAHRQVELVAVGPVVPAFLLAGQEMLAIHQIPNDESNRRARMVLIVVLEHDLVRAEWQARREAVPVEAAAAHPDAFGQADLLSHVVLAAEHAVVGHVVGADRLVADGPALANHDDLPIESAVEVLFVLGCGLGEAEFVRACGEQRAWWRGLEDVGS